MMKSNSVSGIYLDIWNGIKKRKKNALADVSIYMACLTVLLYTSGLIATFRYLIAALLFVSSALFFIDILSILKKDIMPNKFFMINISVLLLIHFLALLLFDLDKYCIGVLGGALVTIISGTVLRK